MTPIRWEPIPMNRLLNSFFDSATAQSAPARRFSPATDLIESDTHYILRADLPGVSEDDVSVELDDNVLSISGQRTTRSEVRTGGYHRLERSSGSFRRAVRLPEGVDGDAIEATFDRGVLEVSVPKPEQPTPRKVQITVGAGAPAIDSPEESAATPQSTEPAAA